MYYFLSSADKYKPCITVQTKPIHSPGAFTPKINSYLEHLMQRCNVLHQSREWGIVWHKKNCGKKNSHIKHLIYIGVHTAVQYSILHWCMTESGVGREAYSMTILLHISKTHFDDQYPVCWTPYKIAFIKNVKNK